MFGTKSPFRPTKRIYLSRETYIPIVRNLYTFYKTLGRNRFTILNRCSARLTPCP